MLFYTTFARRTFTVSLNELFENYTGRHTHVYSGRMTRLKYPPWNTRTLTLNLPLQSLFSSIFFESDAINIVLGDHRLSWVVSSVSSFLSFSCKFCDV